MSEINTATDAVERLAGLVETCPLKPSAFIAATLRALAAERDALRDDWNEIAAGITTEIPEVGALWPVVSEIHGSLEAVRLYFKNEITAHNVTKAERDAARAECLALASQLQEAQAQVARLREALATLRRAITDEDEHNNCSIIDTVWVSGIETAVDFIDAALTEAPRHD